MKYKSVIVLVSLVMVIIVSGFLYIGLTSYLENKGYDNQTIKGILGSFAFIIGLPIAILVNIHYKLKYKK